MSAASNDNDQASDLDEPMGSQSQVRGFLVFADTALASCLGIFSLELVWNVFSRQDSEMPLAHNNSKTNFYPGAEDHSGLNRRWDTDLLTLLSILTSSLNTDLSSQYWPLFSVLTSSLNADLFHSTNLFSQYWPLSSQYWPLSSQY